MVSCEGHAGFSQKGTDIVCAAASVLVINTLNAIEELTDTTYDAYQDADGGVIRAEFNSGVGEGAALLLDAMVMGLKEIERQYGRKYIRLQIENAN